VIFLTVGSQMSFDRLVSAVDDWAGLHPGVEIIAQIGDSALRPMHVAWQPMFTPDECRDLLRSADLVVAHAGMGTILTALQYGRPMLLMPRRGHLQETRNDHQMATAKQLVGRHGIRIALDHSELDLALDELASIESTEPIGPWAEDQLLSAVRSFLAGP
jgi:UDP-N-acetylglucosamine transferase subunit ALG13